MKIFFLTIITCLFSSTSLQSQTGTVTDTLYERAKRCIRSGEYDSAITFFSKLARLSILGGDSLKSGNANIGIGISYDKLGTYDSALHYYFKALSLYEKIANQVKIAGTLKNIGNVYRSLKYYASASDFLNRALVIQEKQRDTAGISHILNDIGLVYMDQNEHEKAYDYFNQVIRKYYNKDDDATNASINNNLGIIYAASGKFDSAYTSYQQSLSLMKATGDKYGVALVTGNLGDLFFKKGNYPAALRFHAESLELAREINSDDLLLNTFENLTRTYQQMGDFKNAFEYSQKVQILKDSVFIREKAKSYAEMETRYHSSQKQLEIERLEQKNSLSALKLENQRKLVYLFFTIGALIFIIAAVTYHNYRKGQRVNKKLNLLNERLENANQSKVKLISILTHDLRSPVSSLFHYLQLMKSKQVQTSPSRLEEINTTISGAAEHLLESMEDLLVWAKTQMDQFEPANEIIDMAHLLNEILEFHKPFSLEKEIVLEGRVEGDIRLDTDLNFLKIVLRNLVTNAVKFTPAGGKVSVSAYKKDSAIIVLVSDTGPGISEADIKDIFEWNSIRSDSSGLGLRLAKEFSDKMGCRLEVLSRPGYGSEFQLIFSGEAVP